MTLGKSALPGRGEPGWSVKRPTTPLFHACCMVRHVHFHLGSQRRERCGVLNGILRTPAGSLALVVLLGSNHRLCGGLEYKPLLSPCDLWHFFPPEWMFWAVTPSLPWQDRCHSVLWSRGELCLPLSPAFSSNLSDSPRDFSAYNQVLFNTNEKNHFPQANGLHSP